MDSGCLIIFIINAALKVTNFQRKKQIWPGYLIASLGGDFPQACTFLLSAIQTQPKNQTFYNDKSEL